MQILCDIVSTRRSSREKPLSSSEIDLTVQNSIVPLFSTLLYYCIATDNAVRWILYFCASYSRTMNLTHDSFVTKY